MRSSFLFAACQPGSEGPARDELAKATGGRVAFSRPGLVTVKVDTEVDDAALDLDLVFARVTGVGGGTMRTPEELDRLVDAGVFTGRPRLFVFERALADDDRTPSPVVAEVESRLRGSGIDFAPAGSVPAPGDAVVDVVVAGDEPAYVGRHIHRAAQIPYAGGRFPLVLPAASPSRAWLKIEEVLAFTGLEARSGEVALDVGAAPGGASLALLDRGLQVIAVDPGEMDVRLDGRPGFSHLRAPVGALKRADLPPRVALILCDMNLAPRITLRYVERLQGPLRQRLRALVLTLKLVDARARDELASYVARVASWGYRDVRMKQLACHRNEVALVARDPGR